MEQVGEPLADPGATIRCARCTMADLRTWRGRWLPLSAGDEGRLSKSRRGQPILERGCGALGAQRLPPRTTSVVIAERASPVRTGSVSTRDGVLQRGRRRSVYRGAGLRRCRSATHPTATGTELPLQPPTALRRRPSARRAIRSAAACRRLACAPGAVRYGTLQQASPLAHAGIGHMAPVQAR